MKSLNNPAVPPLCSRSRCATRLRYTPTRDIAGLFAVSVGYVKGETMNNLHQKDSAESKIVGMSPEWRKL